MEDAINALLKILISVDGHLEHIVYALILLAVVLAVRRK